MSEILVLKNSSTKELSKLQKQFNLNVQKINDLKQQVERTKTQLQQIQIRIHNEIVPLQNQNNQKIIELVYTFDRHYDNPFFKKKEKEKMADFILTKCIDLITHAGKDELKTLFDKYSDEGTFDEIYEDSEADKLEMMKKMMENMMGIHFEEDADVSSPEKMSEYVQEKIEQQQAEEEARKANRKKNEKQIEREEKAREETKNISKAARAIYTDLVKEFHPDREQDEAEKLRKTELMHQITEAYEKNDLFMLLKLKIELQSATIQELTLADEQLKYYNKILKEQVKELEEQLYLMQTGGDSGGMMDMNLYERFGGESDKTMKAKMTHERNRIKNNIKSLEHEIETLSKKERMRDFLRMYEISFESDFWFE